MTRQEQFEKGKSQAISLINIDVKISLKILANLS